MKNNIYYEKLVTTFLLYTKYNEKSEAVCLTSVDIYYVLEILRVLVAIDCFRLLHSQASATKKLS